MLGCLLIFKSERVLDFIKSLFETTELIIGLFYFDLSIWQILFNFLMLNFPYISRVNPVVWCCIIPLTHTTGFASFCSVLLWWLHPSSFVKMSYILSPWQISEPGLFLLSWERDLWINPKVNIFNLIPSLCQVKLFWVWVRKMAPFLVPSLVYSFVISIHLKEDRMLEDVCSNPHLPQMPGPLHTFEWITHEGNTSWLCKSLDP